MMQNGMIDVRNVHIPARVRRGRVEFMTRTQLENAVSHLIGAAAIAQKAGCEDDAKELFFAALCLDELLRG